MVIFTLECVYYSLVSRFYDVSFKAYFWPKRLYFVIFCQLLQYMWYIQNLQLWQSDWIIRRRNIHVCNGGALMWGSMKMDSATCRNKLNEIKWLNQIKRKTIHSVWNVGSRIIFITFLALFVDGVAKSYNNKNSRWWWLTFHCVISTAVPV